MAERHVGGRRTKPAGRGAREEAPAPRSRPAAAGAQPAAPGPAAPGRAPTCRAVPCPAAPLPLPAGQSWARPAAAGTPSCASPSKTALAFGRTEDVLRGRPAAVALRRLCLRRHLRPPGCRERVEFFQDRTRSRVSVEMARVWGARGVRTNREKFVHRLFSGVGNRLLFGSRARRKKNRICISFSLNHAQRTL